MLRLFLLTSLLVSCLGAVPRYRLSPNNGRIVGGEPVEIEDYPYQLSLQWHGKHTCGASVLSENWALTAVFCVLDFQVLVRRNDSHSSQIAMREVDVSKLSLRAGSSIKEEGGSVYDIKNAIVHPDFTFTELDCGIALLQPAIPIVLGDKVKPIGLATSTPLAGSVLTVTGWGSHRPLGPISEQLEMVQVPETDHEICEKEYTSFPIHVTDNMICTSVSVGGKSPCLGDAGGPAVFDNVLVGIVSWSNGCGTPNWSTVYADVAKLRSWITEYTGN